MKIILIIFGLLPLLLVANSSIDYNRLYQNVDFVVEGYLTGEVIEKIRIIKNDPHPDVEFREDTYIYTYLIVDGRLKYSDWTAFPYDTIEVDGELTLRYRILIPEWLYETPREAKKVKQTNAWFLEYSQLLQSLHSLNYLELSRTKMFIHN